MIEAEEDEHDGQNLLSTCEKVLSSLFLRNSFVVVSVEPQTLISSFVLQMSMNMKKVKFITPLLLQIVTNSPDLTHIIELGLISSLLTGSKSHHPHCFVIETDVVMKCLLEIIKHLTTVRIRVKNRREEVISFVDHLVEFGLFSYLINSITWRYQNYPFLQTFTEFIHLSVPEQEIVEYISDLSSKLQQIMKLDEKYFTMVLEICENEDIIPPQLYPLLFEGI